MENVNIGLIYYSLGNELKNRYGGSPLNEETKNQIDKLINIIHDSEILMLEYKVFQNLESKTIEDDLMASRYIDNNINLFESYTIDEILEENKKLNKFNSMGFDKIPNEKLELYESIHSLIIESLKENMEVNVDKIHESFNIVLSHIKTKKENIKPSTNNEINEDVLRIAVDKFNEKYNSLSEDEKKLIHSIVNSDYNEKLNMFENYKNIIIKQLDSNTNENTIEIINKTKTKINEMVVDVSDIDVNIISLFELKTNLNQSYSD